MRTPAADTPWIDRAATLALIIAGACLLNPVTAAIWPFQTDAAELTLCAVTGGVPHSPGYPLWTRMAGAAVTVWPSAHPVSVISWMVAGMAVGAAAFTRALLRELNVGTWAATAGGALLLTIPLCMRAFRVPEVHSLDLLLIASSLWSVAHGYRTNRQAWTSLGLCLAVLAAGHRPINGILLVTIAVGWQVPLHRSRAALFGLGAGAAVQALLYIDLWQRIHTHNGAWVDEAAFPSLEGFVQFISGLTFSRFFIWSANGSGLTVQSIHLGLQGWVLVCMALIGPLVVRPKRMGWAISILAAGHLLLILLYRVPDIEFFFLPIFWAGILVAATGSLRLGRKFRTAAGGIALAGVVGLAMVNHRALQTVHPDAWQNELRAVLESVPDTAVVISDDWPVRTGLVAMREIDQIGTGVEVARVSADAEGAQRLAAWMRGEVDLILSEEHKEIAGPGTLYVYDARLLPHLKNAGLIATPAEADTFRVSLAQ